MKSKHDGKPIKQPTDDPGDIFRSRVPGTGIHKVDWDNGRITVPAVCARAGTGLSPVETSEWIISYYSKSALMLLPKIVFGRQGEGIRASLQQELGVVSDRAFWTLFVEPAKSFAMGARRRLTISKESGLTDYITVAPNGTVLIKPGLTVFIITGVEDHQREHEQAQAQPITTIPAANILLKSTGG